MVAMKERLHSQRSMPLSAAHLGCVGDPPCSDTASTLQCSVGPGLPNNRVVVKKTPQAILLEHGTGNATIVSQPIGYCGGEAYLVDQVRGFGCGCAMGL